MSSDPPAPPPWPDDRVRAYALKAVVAAAFLAGFLLSWKLWLPADPDGTGRHYPTVPVWDGLPPVPAEVGYVWLVLLLALLGAVAALPRPRYFLEAFVGILIALALYDQSRWQPWAYLYAALLFCLAFFPWGEAEPGPDGRAVLNACRLIVALTYVWSGVQKLNITFTDDVFPWLIKPAVPKDALDLASRGALLAPLIELGMGLALLVPAWRNMGVVLALGMHAGILYCLGPLGLWWNTVVWPWNVAMMAFVVVLFARLPREVVWPRRSALGWAVVVLFGVLPVLSFWERWDAYLSACLYSGNTPDAKLKLPRDAGRRLPEAVRDYAHPTGDGRYRVDLFDWSLEELNVPPYPAERVFRGVGRLVQGTEAPQDGELVIEHPPHWLTGRREASRYTGRGLDEPVPEVPEPEPLDGEEEP